MKIRNVITLWSQEKSGPIIQLMSGQEELVDSETKINKVRLNSAPYFSVYQVLNRN